MVQVVGSDSLSCCCCSQAVAIAALNLLDQDDIKKLMKTDLIPQWVQFPEMERVSSSLIALSS